MSSSEQAPEPTMDEILASIRKIISDDEPGETPQPEAASPAPELGAPAPEPAAPAEDGLAEDLANALNDTQAGAQDADDILDLTQIVEEQPQAAEPQMEAPQGDALQAALGDVTEAVAAPAPESEPAPAPQVAQGEPDAAVGDVDIASLLAEAGVQDTVAETPAEQQAPAAEDFGAILGQGEETAAPAVEEAPISEALSAMSPQASEPFAEAVPDAAMPESEPMETSQPAPSASVEASLDTGVYTPEAAQEVAAPEIPDIPEVPEAAAEAPVQEDAGFAAAGDMTAEAPQVDEPAAAPEAPVEDVDALAGMIVEPEPAEATAPAEEQAPEEVAGAAPAGGAGKTLEDSVKELLRPMLREWLDDNMERIVQDEVVSGNLNSQDS